MNDVPDPLDEFLRAARPVAPEGLADRLLAASQDPELAAKLYWAEAAESAGRALLLSAAGLLISAGALLFSYSEPAVVAVPGGVAQVTPAPTAKTTAFETPQKDTPTEIAVELDEASDPLELALNTELQAVTNEYPLLQGGK